MSSSRRTRRQQKSLHRHQLRLEGLEKRYALNAAPVLDPAASPQLNSVIENAGVPVGQVGTLVSDLIDIGGTHNNFSDADGDLPGIAITETSTQGGTLYYSTDDGVTWSDVGAVNYEASLGLFADSLTRIYFKPAPTFYGEIKNVLSYRAWDRTNGISNGITINNSGSSHWFNKDATYFRDILISSDGKTAFLSCHVNGLLIVDITNSSSPFLLSSTEFGANARKLILSDDDSTVYVSDSTNSLHIVDVSDLASPVIIGVINNTSNSYNPPTDAKALVLSADGDTIYLGQDGISDSFQVIDVSDPINPTITTTISPSSPFVMVAACDVALLENGTPTAVVAGYPGGIWIHDLGGSSSLDTVPNLDLLLKDIQLSSDGKYVYGVGGGVGTSKFSIIDLSDINSPVIIGSTATSGLTQNIEVNAEKNYAHAADMKFGLHTLDISNPANPLYLETIDSPGWVFDSVISDDGTVYIADGNQGLYIVPSSDALSLSADHVGIIVESNNVPPTLNSISDQVFDEDTQQVVSLTGISGDGGGALPVQITAVSSNTDLISAISLDHVPTESTGSLTLVPAENAHGNAEITVTVENGGADDDLATLSDNLIYTVTFDVTVVSINDPPSSSSSFFSFGLTRTIDQGSSIYVDKRVVTDADGLDANALVYEWHLDDTLLTYPTGNSLGGSFTAPQSKVGKTFSCHVSYVDNEGYENSFVYGSWVIRDINSPPARSYNADPLKVNGVPVPSEELSIDVSSIRDDDGLGDFNYQWGRSLRHTFLERNNSGEYFHGFIELPSRNKILSVYNNQLMSISTIGDDPTAWFTEEVIDLPLLGYNEIMVNGDESKLFVIGQDTIGTGIVVIDIRSTHSKNWAILKTFETQNYVSDIALTTDGRTLFATSRFSTDLSVYDVEGFDPLSWGLVRSISDVFYQGSSAIVLSADGRKAYASQGKSAVNGHSSPAGLIAFDISSADTNEWDVIRSIGISDSSHANVPTDIILMPDSKHVLLAQGYGFTVVDVASEDANNWNIVRQFDVKPGEYFPGTINANNMRLLSDGTKLLVPGTLSDELYVIDVSDVSPNNWSNLGIVGTAPNYMRSSPFSVTKISHAIPSFDEKYLFIIEPTLIEVLDYDLLESNDFSAFQIIDGATQATYTPTEDDVGSRMAVEISYVDGGGFDNSFQTFVNPLIRSDYPPTIDLVSDATINEDGPEHVVSLTGITAGSSESQPLRVTAVSSNTDLIPDPTVAYTSSDSTGSLAFTPVADQHGTATITVTVEDGGLDNILATPADNATFETTFDVIINPVNDSPTLDPLPDLSPTGRDLMLPEDSSTQVITLTGISSGDGESQPIRVTAESNNPDLIPHPNVSYVSPDTTGTLSFSPISNRQGPVTITVTVEDGGLDGDLLTTGDNRTTTDSLNIYVRQLSDRPVLNPLSFTQSIQSLKSAGIPEGPVGTLVSSLIDKDGLLSNFSDADNHDLPGIAITALNLQGGGLYYTDDSGVTWSAVEAVNDASPLLLKADDATRLYYKPAENVSGRLENTFTYKAWDRNTTSLAGLWTSFNARTIKLSSDNTKAFVSRSKYPVDDLSIPTGFVILDLSDATNPQEIGHLDLTEPSYHLDLSPDEQLVYITEQENGLKVVDVSDPSNPVIVGTFDAAGLVRRVRISADGSKAILLDSEWHTNPESESVLRILDVSSPSEPLLLGSYNLDEPALGLTLSSDESLAFIANSSNGIQVINIADPSNPYLTGSFETEGWAHDVSLSADQQTIYVADGPTTDEVYNTPGLSGGLSIYNISNLSQVSLVGKIDTPDQTQSVTLSADGNTAYVADSGGGLLVVDIVNPAEPVIKHVIDTWGWANGSTIVPNEDILFISGGNNGIEIIDLDVTNSISTASARVDVEIIHAPVLDSTASPKLNPISEDAGAPVGQVGTLVSDLIDASGTHGNFSDADGDLPGIAITKTDLQGGSLWYSKDDGLSWLDFGTVTDNSPRLLMADAATRVYLQPAADFAGSLHDVFTFKAWDRFGAWRQLGSDLDGEGQYDNSGWSVSLSEDGRTVAIGARYNSENGDQAGHARVYRYDGSQWTQLGNDFDGDAALDMDGWSVSLAGNGNAVAIGSCFNDANGSESGRVRIYDWDGITWSQRGSSILGTNINDQLGRSVSLSSDGMTVGIGARLADGGGEESGAAIIYRWTGSDWNQLGSSINGSSAYDEAGSAVALSKDGLTIAVGAPLHDLNGGDSGQVRVFKWDGTVWQQLGLDLVGSNAGDQFGHALAVSEDGTTLAVGAIGSDGNGDKSGSTQVYRWDGLAWNQLGEKLVGRSPGVQFGYSVALSSDGNSLAVGAPDEAGSGHNWDPVRVFQWHDNEWAQTGNDILQESNDDRSGFSVSLSARGDYMAIGAINNYGSFAGSGHTRIYEFAANPNNLSSDSDTISIDVLEVISNQDSAILAKDSAGNLYVNTQPVIYQGQQVPQAFFGSFVVGADTSDSENALLLQPLGADAEDAPTHRLLTDETWRINGIFNSLQNASSQVIGDRPRVISETFTLAWLYGNYYSVNGFYVPEPPPPGSGMSSTYEPVLSVRRGHTYSFNLTYDPGSDFLLNTPYPIFSLRLEPSDSSAYYSQGFDGNGQATGVYNWTVAENAPEELYYSYHTGNGAVFLGFPWFGKIIVVD